MQNKRTTLGLLSNENLNTRKSVGTSIKNNIKTPHKNQQTPYEKKQVSTTQDQRLSVMGRPSVSNRLSVSGRNSVVGNNRLSLSSNQKRKNAPQDRRPINDKDFMRDSVNIILKYLDGHGYSEPISAKDLQSAPSQKTYTNVFLFLFNQIDPSFRFVNKPHEEIPELLKLIGYPVNISKRSFLSVGGLHVWPSLLATLSWMVELLCFNNENFKNPDYEIIFEPNEQYDMIFTECRDRLFFEYVRAAYSNYLCGENGEQLENEYKNIFQNKNDQLIEDTNRIIEDNDKYEKEIEYEKQKLGKLKEMENLKLSLEGDIASHNKSMDDVKLFNNNADQRYESINKQIKELQREINTIQEDKKILENKLNEQIKKQINFQQIAETKKMLDEKINNSDNKAKQLETRLEELEINLYKYNTSIKSKIEKYNNFASKLQLVPQKNPNDPNFELVFEGHLSVVRLQNEEQPAEISKNISPLLSTLKKGLVHSHDKLVNDIETIQEQINETNDLIVEKKNDLNDSQLKFELLEKNYNNKKNNLNEELSTLRQNSYKMQKQIENTRDDIEIKIRNLSIHIQELEEKQKQEIEKMNQEKAETQDKITKILEHLYTHKEHIQNHLKILQIKQSSINNMVDNL